MKQIFLILTFTLSLFASNIQNNLVTYYKVWKQDFLVDEGKYGIRVAMDKKDKTRTTSESQAYGLLIVSMMARYDKDAKTIFDKLYLYSRVFHSPNCKNFMTWQTPIKKGDSDSAFDGDADIAYSLLVADKMWGSLGNINYKQEAINIISSLKQKVIGKDSYLPLLGDWVKQNGKKYNQYTTRSSDFMLGHFRTFYKVTGDKTWLKVIKQTQKAMLEIIKLPQNRAKLVSDFLYYDKRKKHFFPTKRKFLEEEDNSYYYNACRVPFRVGVDALFSHDRTSTIIAKVLTISIAKTAHFKANGIKSGYRLDGSVIGNYNSSAFIAPLLVGAMLEPKLKSFEKSIYNYIKNRHINYYEDSLNLLAQLVYSGEFVEKF
jgi:endo-1,4-beta-D-glucanase Y